MPSRPRTASAALLAITVAALGGVAVHGASSATAAQAPSVTTVRAANNAALKPRPAARKIARTALTGQDRPTVTAGNSSSSSQQIIPFAANNAWILRADNASSLAPDSDAQVANLVNQVKASVGNRAHINAFQYNTAIYFADASTPRVTVQHNNCQGTGLQGEMYTGRKIFVDVPIPADAVPATGTDGQLTIYDPTSDMLWDLWVANKSSNGTWSACWGGRIDDVSENRGYFTGTEGASASGMAIAGGAITIEDVKKGSIDHALNLNIRNTAGWQNWTWPAMRADGTGSAGWGSLRQGQRLRLDPSIDVTKLGLNKMGTMIARAAQQYGFIVTDTSGTVSLVTESGTATKQRTGVDPWDSYLEGPEWEVLANFPWERMQALPLAYGK